MSKSLGAIIDLGKPDADGVIGGSGATSAGNSEPEIIHGFEVESADTEPIGNAGTGSGDGSTRRTKTGRIDRRTKAGRSLAGTGSASATEEKESVHLASGKIDLESAIFGIHEFLSDLSGIEELSIDEEEAKKLADATKELGKHYAITFDPKKVAMFNFAVACGKVYIPRVIAIKNNAKKRKAPALAAVPKTETNSKPNGVAHETPVPGINPIELLGGAADIAD